VKGTGGSFIRRRRSLPLFALVLLVAATVAEASRVRWLNLEELVASAGRVVAGRCVGVRVERDPALGQWVTRATFRVERAVKGAGRGDLTIALLGGPGPGPAPDGAVRPGASAPAAPAAFREGEEVVLFLYPDSRAGLTSPVGLGQGKFLVLRDKLGRPLAANGPWTGRLLDGLSPEAERRLGPAVERWRGAAGLPPDVLLDLAAALARGPDSRPGGP
jgi:hypothetical protein